MSRTQNNTDLKCKYCLKADKIIISVYHCGRRENWFGLDIKHTVDMCKHTHTHSMKLSLQYIEKERKKNIIHNKQHNQYNKW